MATKIQTTMGWMLSLDSMLCVKASHTSQYRIVRDFFRMISRLGDGVFWYTLMIAFVAIDQLQGLQTAWHMICVGLTGTIVYKWLKKKTLRPRPYQVRQDVWLSGVPLDHFSFPSGHTLHAVAFGLVAVQYYPALTWLIMPFVALVGMSRVILGLHYPSDVIAGATIGYGLVLLFQPLF